jgi:hypothetical protein
LRTDASKLTETAKLTGPQARSDDKTYKVWHRGKRGGAKQYLVDDTGKAVYLVDPGINGTVTKRPDGSEVKKFDAPKATLSFVHHQGQFSIASCLGRSCFFGVMIAIVLEMAGASSLAFAVGVYLPIATSMPIFVGGMIRWLVDWQRRRHAELCALHRRGITLRRGTRARVCSWHSGYIAGGAIAGIVIAIMAGVPAFSDLVRQVWVNGLKQTLRSQPALADADFADLLSLIPFAVLLVILYLTGRGAILSGCKIRKVVNRLV